MAVTESKEYLKIVGTVKNTPHQYLWSSYDAEADVLHINFKKPSHATDSELTEDDIIVRYENEEVVGLTICARAKDNVTMETDPTKAYNQDDATGFIRLNGLRLKVLVPAKKK